MRIAHLSDLHLLSLEGVGVARFLNKRLSGYANLRLRRKSVHRPKAVKALVKALANDQPDHVVVTGDLTNLALEAEFELCQAVLRELGMPADRVSIIPGNHDTYTRGAHRARRFEGYFAENITSDVTLQASDHGPFPFVRLREHVAIIGLSSAIPKLPFVAAGTIGEPQLGALRQVLAHPEVVKRFPVVLVHHPPVNPRTAVERALGGLADAAELQDALGGLARGLVLHGHLHRRIRRALPTCNGSLEVIGATSASLVSGGPHRRAGFNVYDIEPDGTVEVSARVWTDADDALHVAEVPRPRVGDLSTEMYA